MSDNARFHNKLHRKNHHSSPTTGYPDSATDPIASAAEPFQGDFYINGNLNVNGGVNTTYQTTLSNISIQSPVLSATVGFNPTNSLIVQLSGNKYAIPVTFVGNNLAPAVIVNTLSGNTTFFNGVSVTGSLSGVDSNRWNLIYTTVRGNSALWNGGFNAFTNVNTNSAAWQDASTAVITGSANWQAGAAVNTYVQGNSATFDSSYNVTVYAKLSAQPYTLNRILSSIKASNVSSNVASGNFSTVLGGSNNISSGSSSVIAGGGSNTASGLYAAIVGGTGNNVSGNYSVIGGISNAVTGNYSSAIGGTANIVVGDCSATLGGTSNTLSGCNSFILGSNIILAANNTTAVNNLSSAGSVCGVFFGNGANITDVLHASDIVYTKGCCTGSITPVSGANTASGQYSIVGGGTGNVASGDYSFIGAGESNIASGRDSTVVGGTCNCITGLGSNIVGGYCNTASSNYSTVAGGKSNTASGNYSGIGSGIGNTASGKYSFTVGNNNIASGNCSAVLGGKNNSTNSQYNTFILGSNIKATLPNFTYLNNLSSSGSVCANLFFGDGTNLTSTTYIYGRDCTNTATNSIIPKLGNNTASSRYSFVAGGSGNDTKGYANTFILGSTLSASCANYTYVNNISSQGCFVTANGNSNNWNAAATAVIPNSANWNSAYNKQAYTLSNPITATITTLYGGNSACGCFSAISSGTSNTIAGSGSFIGGGTCNSVNGFNSSVVVGLYNTSSSCYSAIIGGTSNSSLSALSVVAGGAFNTASGYASFIGGGQSNIASGNNSVVLGGTLNSTNRYCNTFILGSALSASCANYTYVNNLSTQGTISTLRVSTSSLQVGSISATGGGTGSITAKMPIYNQTGAFVGYIPIYTS
jgi:hypothetical protein